MALTGVASVLFVLGDGPTRGCEIAGYLISKPIGLAGHRGPNPPLDPAFDELRFIAAASCQGGPYLALLHAA